LVKLINQKYTYYPPCLQVKFQHGGFFYTFILEMDPAKLSELTISLQKGEKLAYREIYSDFFGVLYHLANQYLHDEAVSEEIVQDTFMKLWEIRETLNEHFNVHNFLYTITKNSCLNYLRNQKTALLHQRNIKYLEMQYNYVALERLGSYLEFEELFGKINQAISLLPEELRETFVLSRYEELHYKEIADKQLISIKTVAARISRALRILRLELKDYIPVIILIFKEFL